MDRQICNRKKVGRGALAVGFLIAVTVAGTSFPASAADGDAFNESDPRIFIAQSPQTDGPTELYQVVTNGGGTYELGTGEPPNPDTAKYNAIGFNSTDDYLYGMVEHASDGFPAGSLVRIGEGNTVERIGTEQYAHGNAAVPDSNWFVGDFNPLDGKYYATGAGQPDILAVDINTWKTAGEVGSPPKQLVPVKNEAGAPTDLPLIHDFAIDADGFAYSIVRGGEQVARIDLNPASTEFGTLRTFQTSSFAGGSSPFTETDSPSSPAQYGALWFFGNGNLGVSSNQSGKIYQIDIGGTAADPTFRLVSAVEGPTSRQNDGASTRGADVDLSVVKTATPTYRIGDTITYTLTVKNENPVGGGTSSGWTLTDAIPAGLTNVSLVAPAAGPTCTVNGSNVTCSGGRLAPQETESITIEATAESAPSTPSQCYVNVANVLGNEADPVAANNRSEAETCPPENDLVVTKSSNPDENSTVVAGDQVTYTVSFRASGTAASGVARNDDLSDVLDDATFVEGSLETVSDPAGVTAAYNNNGTPDVATDDRIEFRGTVPAGQTRTISYAVTVKPDGERGDNLLSNVVFRRGETPPEGPCAAGDPLCTSHPVPGATLDKQVSRVVDVDKDGYTDRGDHIFFEFVVTNTGRTVLTDVKVDDPLLKANGISVRCDTTTLDPTKSTRCRAEEPYVITEQDVNNGKVRNTAVAFGTPPGKPPVETPPDETETPTEDPPPSSLASTGADVPIAALTAGVIALLAGLVFLVFARRRRRTRRR